MKELREKLITIDKETDWLAIGRDCARLEDQLRIRADIGWAIKNLEKQTGQDRYVPDHSVRL